MPDFRPAIFQGAVKHHRRTPVHHRFSYRVAMMLLDLDTLENTASKTWLFSYNRPNLFSFYDQDHGSRRNLPLRPWVKKQLQDHDIRFELGTILLLAVPRVLGFVFNPLSVYYCFNCHDQLAAIIYEVKNTFGEQHCYVVSSNPIENPAQPKKHKAKKVFYVSPFIGMEARYRFHARIPSNRLSLMIREFVKSQEVMVATLAAHRSDLRDSVLAKVVFKYPLLTIKIILAIYWEALRLCIKRVPRFPRNKTNKVGSNY